MINEPGFRENLWRRFEGAVDAFQDTDREVLPKDAWRFILYFANQAKRPVHPAAARSAARRARSTPRSTGRSAG